MSVAIGHSWPRADVAQPVEQLFRKSLAVCAVLPRVEARYKRAHLSAIRFEAVPV